MAKKITTTEQKKDATNPTVTVIPALDERVVKMRIVGTAPYMQLRFSQKAMNAMRSKMEEGSTARSKKQRGKRDFDEDYKQSMHVSTGGWTGIPASAFRQAMISACRLVGFKMTLAKLSISIVSDGIDKVDGMPLIKIEGKPEKVEMPARNANGSVDIRVRALWRQWSATVAVKYDAAQFTMQDVVNLMSRVGAQVGIGEGRPDSRNSAGLGFGTFMVK